VRGWALLRAGGLKRCGSKGSFSELRAGGSGALQKAHFQNFLITVFKDSHHFGRTLGSL